MHNSERPVDPILKLNSYFIFRDGSLTAQVKYNSVLFTRRKITTVTSRLLISYNDTENNRTTPCEQTLGDSGKEKLPSEPGSGRGGDLLRQVGGEEQR